jgi:excisionase family DNA binding protein
MQSGIIEISSRQFVTAATLAGLLHLHKRTIMSWASDYEMPVVSVGNLRLFDLADVSAWFDQHKLGRAGRAGGRHQHCCRATRHRVYRRLSRLLRLRCRRFHRRIAHQERVLAVTRNTSSRRSAIDRPTPIISFGQQG